VRIGIIDLGTNSVRFDVHQIQNKYQVKLLHREKLMVRLGQGVFLDNRLDSSAIRRTLHAFQSFKRTASVLHAEKVIAFGTSALREACDSNKLIQQIRQKTGIDIRVISGEEEAYLIADGILNNELQIKEKLGNKFGLIDIGGGSTEISICHQDQILFSASFPLGTARLQQVFLKTSPPPKNLPGTLHNPIPNLRKYIRSVLFSQVLVEKWPKTNQMIGSSGTIRALEKILRKTHGSEGIDRKDLSKLVKAMSTMTHSELLSIPGIEPKRVDMILSGAILLEECMEVFDANSVMTTNYSLRDGILDREVRLESDPLEGNSGFQLEDIYLKAEQLGQPRKNLDWVSEFAAELFEKTRRLHKLSPKWRHIFCAAVILRNSGKTISPIHYEAHSDYIVRNADFPGMEKWEAEFIAQLCMKHTSTKITKKDLGFLTTKEQKRNFLKILALLSVTHALNQDNSIPLTIKNVRVTQKLIHIRISGKNLTDLEILRVDQKKVFFERTLRRSLRIDRI
jgi:exopolyphosphatase/guanosine-5'-triphosphate,3'-diphosphate pyrophosphatase